MTDYAKPVTAKQVCELIADDLDFKSQELRRQARLLYARAKELEEAAADVRMQGHRWEKWQPVDAASEDVEPTHTDRDGS